MSKNYLDTLDTNGKNKILKQREVFAEMHDDVCDLETKIKNLIQEFEIKYEGSVRLKSISMDRYKKENGDSEEDKLEYGKAFCNIEVSI